MTTETLPGILDAHGLRGRPRQILRALPSADLLRAAAGDRVALSRLLIPRLGTLCAHLLRQGIAPQEIPGARRTILQQVVRALGNLRQGDQIDRVLRAASAVFRTQTAPPRHDAAGGAHSTTTHADAAIEALSLLPEEEGDEICRALLLDPAHADLRLLARAYRRLGEEIRTGDGWTTPPEDLLPCPEHETRRMRRLLGLLPDPEGDGLRLHESACRFCASAAARLEVLHQCLRSSLEPARLDPPAVLALLRELAPSPSARTGRIVARLLDRRSRRPLYLSVAAHAALLLTAAYAAATAVPPEPAALTIAWESPPRAPEPPEFEPALCIPAALQNNVLSPRGPVEDPTPLSRSAPGIPDAPALPAPAPADLLSFPSIWRPAPPPVSPEEGGNPPPLTSESTTPAPAGRPAIAGEAARRVGDLRACELERNVTTLWLRTARRLMQEHAVDLESLDAARAYVLGTMHDDVAAALSERHHLRREEVLRTFDARPAGRASHYATYGSGSWLVDGPAQGIELAEAPQAWWEHVRPEARRNYLWALYCEGRMRVCKRGRMRCDACVGEGRLHFFNPAGLAPGQETTTCPVCCGTGSLRQIWFE